MAKVGLKSGMLYRRRGMTSVKKANVVLRVSRVERRGDGVSRLGMQTGHRAFVACASFKTGGWVKIAPHFEPSKLHNACAFGKNPRAAMAGALRKAAAHVSKRSGSFAGYSKTHRKSRRQRRRSKRY